MCLIDDDGIISAVGLIHFLINDREFLESSDNNTGTGVDGVPQILAGLVLTDGLHGAESMIKAGDGLL